MATWPVFIMGDDPKSLTFKVANGEHSCAVAHGQGHSLSDSALEDVLNRVRGALSLGVRKMFRGGWRETLDLTGA